MKKKLIVLVLVCFCLNSFSQELNNNALKVKELLPETYTEFLTFAKNKWDTDYEMVIHTVNQQANAMFEMHSFLKSEDFDKNLLMSIIYKWTKDEIADYEMIVYEYKRQLNAKKILGE